MYTRDVPIPFFHSRYRSDTWAQGIGRYRVLIRYMGMYLVIQLYVLLALYELIQLFYGVLHHIYIYIYIYILVWLASKQKYIIYNIWKMAHLFKYLKLHS